MHLRSKANCRIQAVEWTGRPKSKHLREYVRFCHVVYSHLADHWQLRLLNVVQTRPTLWEIWEYRPGQAPKLTGDFNTQQGVL
jgi:hypothetical protein